ncbi:polysaccharide deacetylase family protein [Pelagimonas sp. KU-00592-HH]|uniref:polysaccharide deacetylase family protein n=1 Tax=Pelagimonas sp. KU-00592-HH TaxID=3127651 RepID=UPI00310A59DB
MKIDWSPLRQELAIWREQGLILPFWWRDDDAIQSTAHLDRMHEMSRALGVPVHLAVIPKTARPELATYVDGRQNLIPVIHGWAHENHAPPEAKKVEFGATRRPEDARADLQNALARLQGLFGARLAPMFVPPWNRIAPDLMPALAAIGYTAISTYTPRKAVEPAPGVVQINTHIDPIFWRGTRGLVAPETLVAQTVQLLQDRRNGNTDAAEPLGYLTHHLVHDADIWDFTRQFLSEMQSGPITLYRHDQA